MKIDASELSEIEQDALAEIANMGVSRAAASLRRMVGVGEPVGKFVNSTAATFTMVHCADTNDRARAEAEESFVWYPKTAGRSIAWLASWMAGEGKDLGNYAYAGDAL